MLLLLAGVKLLIMVVSVLLSVAFLTLFERKALSYLQIRKGPNKWGVKGVLQPFNDAVKLFSKEVMYLSFTNFLLYYLSPLLVFSIAIFCWFSFPSSLGGLEITMVVIFILCCLSAGVYPILGAGWASNSKYAVLGSLRAVAQTISYEVSFAITVLSLVVMNLSYSLEDYFLFSKWNTLLILPLGFVWFISTLAETNRTPFDFAEGESELVSGFNTEFSSGSFALFFLAEYTSILFMSLLTVVLFLAPGGSGVLIATKLTLVVYLFLWVRGTLPRLRYDKLMMLAWKLFLPCVLSYLFLLLSVLSLLFTFKSHFF